MIKTCFVIMPIGRLEYNNNIIEEEQLRNKYNNLIKEAILKAYPDLEVTRADEVSAPGTISTDIITRIMHSDIVIADITYPNPNVFYELGLRHACKSGTILIKEKISTQTPFDISHLRHIMYENTTNGLQVLSKEIGKIINLFLEQPDKPDNHFLEIAKLTSYQYPNYSKKQPNMTNVMMAISRIPSILDFISSDMPEKEKTFLKNVLKNPDLLKALLDTTNND